MIPFQNRLEANSRLMQSSNRDLISSEISKMASYESLWVDRIRNGTMDFGALQMTGFISDQNFMRIGATSGSTTVGP